MNRVVLAAMLAVLLQCPSWAGDPPNEKRALPPKWTAADEEIFFDDAREFLAGPRPNFSAQQVVRATPSTGGGSTDEPAGGGYEWSGLIDAEVIEGEIKRVATQVAPLVQSASGFKGGKYRDARNHFTMIAVLFGTAAEYDDDVRWKDSARALSQLFGRAGFNCKVGTDQSFRESQLRSQDLADLIRGGRPSAPNPDPDAGWDALADRSPLMVRMELGLGERLGPNMSDARTFSRNAEDLAHEAQIMAILGEIISRDGMADAGDETYDGYAHSLRDGAVEFNKAVELDSFDAAVKALGKMKKSCSDCHGDYRG